MRAYTLATRFVVSAALRLWAHEIVVHRRGPQPERALVQMQRWCRRAWRRLRLTVQVLGEPHSTPCLYLANHRSYLDIAVLSGALGVTFLSRADVAAWPVFGKVARATGTVFVDRQDAKDRVRAAREMLRRLRAMPVAVFPEGTTRGDPLPGPFAPGVCRLLRRAAVPVIPVTLRYSDRRAYWVDDIGMLEHLRTRVLAGPGLTCAVHVGSPLPLDAAGGREPLDEQAYRAVARPIETLGELCAPALPMAD